MAGKTDPGFVVDTFQHEIDRVLDVHDVTCAALQGERIEYRRAASRDAFFRAAVLFDAFRSDWFIACINRKPEKFTTAYGARLRESLKSGKFRGMVPHVAVDLPNHPSLTVIAAILDPDGRHISFGDKWPAKATDLLDPVYASKVTSLTSSDRKLVKAMTSVRDCIAHGSPSSAGEMNISLDALDPTTDADLRRDTQTARVRVSGIPTYLHATAGDCDTRAERYALRLKQITEQLRP